MALRVGFEGILLRHLLIILSLPPALCQATAGHLCQPCFTERGTGPFSPCSNVLAPGGFSRGQEKGEMSEIFSNTSSAVLILQGPSVSLPG